MKKEKWIKVLMYLPLFIAILSIGFMNDKIPIHYDSHGVVNRWGSKFEIFLVPIFTILYGYFLLWIRRISSREEKHGNNNFKIANMVIFMGLVVFNIINIFIIYGGFTKLEDIRFERFNIAYIIFVITGLFFIFLGNKMPKLKKNTLIGLRTSWAMKNDITWKKSQKLGGIFFIIMGIVTIITPLIFDLVDIVLYYAFFIVACAFIMTFLSFFIYKKYGNLE